MSKNQGSRRRENKQQEAVFLFLFPKPDHLCLWIFIYLLLKGCFHVLCIFSLFYACYSKEKKRESKRERKEEKELPKQNQKIGVGKSRAKTHFLSLLTSRLDSFHFPSFFSCICPTSRNPCSQFEWLIGCPLLFSFFSSAYTTPHTCTWACGGYAKKTRIKKIKRGWYDFPKIRTQLIEEEDER